MAEIAQKRLFRQPVLSQRQSAGARTDRHALREKFDRRRRHVLPLEGDDVDALSEAGERRLVVERGDGPRRRRVIGRRRLFGGEDVGAQADLQRRHGEHAAELAGAENADRRAGA